MPIDTICEACGALLRVPRKLINAGEPIPCLKCGSPIDMLRVAAEAAGARQPVAARHGTTATEACEFCDVRLRKFKFLQAAVKVCPRCGKQLTADEQEAEPVAAAQQADEAEPLSTMVTVAESNDQMIALPRHDAEDDTQIEIPEKLTQAGLLDGPSVAAFVIVGFGMVLASVEPLSLWSKPLSGLGLVVALAGGVAALCQQRAIVAPAALSALCLFSIFLIGPWDAARGRPVPPPMPDRDPNTMHAAQGFLPGMDARTHECSEWLKTQLGQGPRRLVLVQAEADKSGFDAKVLQAAKVFAGVGEVESQGQTWWKLERVLPPPSAPSQLHPPLQAQKP